jgi:DnaJ-class molecular chaperone
MNNTPHKCPVCSGTGNVLSGFYLGGGAVFNASTETCRSCSGTGIVWESNPNAIFDPPQETQEQRTRRIQQMLRNDSGDFRDTPIEPK